MNQKPKYTEPTTNSNIAASGYNGLGQFINMHKLMRQDNDEEDLYFYHGDLPKAFGMGSSSWITDGSGNACTERSRSVNQYLAYMPFGESFINQRNADGHDIRFKFTGKERDSETGFDYFGARYYSSDLSIWLSVDPLASMFPGISPYAYVFNNPINFIDKWGLEGDPTNSTKNAGTFTGVDGKTYTNSCDAVDIVAQNPNPSNQQAEAPTPNKPINSTTDFFRAANRQRFLATSPFPNTSSTTYNQTYNSTSSGNYESGETGGGGMGEVSYNGYAISLTSAGLQQFLNMNVKDLKNLQNILEANSGVSSMNINNMILNNAKWIKRTGVIGNVANGILIGVNIYEHGQATPSDIVDGVAAVVAFIPGYGWAISTAITLGKDNVIILNRLSQQGVPDFYLYSGFAGPRW